MENEQPNGEEMSHRQITLADGRYMIFYAFGAENLESKDASVETLVKLEPSDQVGDQGEQDV